MFFQLKFYPTDNHSFRLFQHLETETKVKGSVFGRECDVAFVHMLHYNARVTCVATFMKGYNELVSTNQNRILTLAILENSIYTVKS